VKHFYQNLYKYRMKRLLPSVLFFTLLCTSAIAQRNDSLSFSAYLETYYQYDFNQPAGHNRPGFLYNHTRHNEFNLNLVMAKAAYRSASLRANIAAMAGNYPAANLAAEPQWAQNIYEANVGVKLSKTDEFWLDAGILPSHIGMETAVGKDNWAATRSITADNSPYYETGARLGYTTKNGKWYLSALLLNGWQSVARPDGLKGVSAGTQITFTPNSKLSINSSSFIGNVLADSVNVQRLYHDLYAIYSVNEKLSLAAGFDIGSQQRVASKTKRDTWTGISAMLKMNWQPDKLTTTLRAERYNDAQGIIFETGTPKGFALWHYSFNLDYRIHPKVLWRVEARLLQGDDKIFVKENAGTRSNLSLATMLCFHL
jgi:Putative beta-barrel porin-2, OmpL-like. bbp2